jgi:membrane dipeptidase
MNTASQVEKTERFGIFEFGMTPEAEARAAQLHADSLIVDMIVPGPSGYRDFTTEMDTELRKNWTEHRDSWRMWIETEALPVRRSLASEDRSVYDCWHEAGVTVMNREITLDYPEMAWRSVGFVALQFDRFAWLRKALVADDMIRAKTEGMHAGFINSQSAFQFVKPGELDLLEVLHDLGCRMVQLTYNRVNHVGSGCTERVDSGLSNFGVAVVRRMNELGMIVDLGHCGAETTLDACRISRAPVVASHSSAAGVYSVRRAKSDAELKAIAETGGVIGVYAVPFFLSSIRPASIESMLDHIQYIADLVGWQHVGIGTDWPLPFSKWALRDVLSEMFVADLAFEESDPFWPDENLVGFDDYRDFPNITRGLVSRGFDDEQIRGILGENVLRVFRDVCG